MGSLNTEHKIKSGLSVPHNYFVRASTSLAEEYGKSSMEKRTTSFVLDLLEHRLSTKMAVNGIEFDNFSEGDFSNLLHLTYIFFEFIDFSKLQNMIDSMGSSKFVYLFLRIDHVFDEMFMAFLDTEKNKERSEKIGLGNVPFETFVAESLNARESIFDNLLKTIQENPHTPVELLVELL